MSGKFTFGTLLALTALTLTACADRPTNLDYGVDGMLLEDRAAGIWIDGNGCDHWIIDDGIEGYMSPRLTDEGKPVCREGSVPFSTIDFERSTFGE